MYGGPVCVDLYQQPDLSENRFCLSGKWRCAAQREWKANLSPAVAGAKERQLDPSVFGREGALGPGTLFTGIASGPVSARRSGGISAIFMEVRWLYAGIDYI